MLEHRKSNVLNQTLAYYFKFVIIVSDKIEMYYEDGAKNWTKVPLLRTGIAWPADKNYKFRNPKMDNMNLEQSWCSSYFETFLPVDFHKFAFAFKSYVLHRLNINYHIQLLLIPSSSITRDTVKAFLLHFIDANTSMLFRKSVKEVFL